MKEVYVLHGRMYWNEGVTDHEGNYFEESPCVEVFESFDAAKAKLREYAIMAYNYLKECGAGYLVDDTFVDRTSEDDLFSDYNMWSEDDFDEEEFEELRENDDKSIRWDEIRRDLAWQYDEGEDSVSWQMYCINLDCYDDKEPILAGFRIRKCVINS